MLDFMRALKTSTEFGKMFKRHPVDVFQLSRMISLHISLPDNFENLCAHGTVLFGLRVWVLRGGNIFTCAGLALVSHSRNVWLYSLSCKNTY